jgi:hypothetical protein
MIVRIRFGHGRLVTSQKGKNSHAARLTASLLSLVAICLGIFGFWRLGEDLGITGDFVFSTGFLSHWQVWIGAGAATEYACWRLTRYSRLAGSETSVSASEELANEELASDQAAAKKIGAEKVTARV